jgi:hypothetical protein
MTESGVAPAIVFCDGFVGFFDCLGERDQPFRRVRTTIEQHVFHELEQVFGNFFIHREHAGIDDPHVHAGLDGMIEKRRMHRFAHRIIAAERERNVADAAAHFRQRQVLLDPARRLDEIDRVVVVLFDTGADGENVRIENNLLRRKADVLR